MNAAVFLAADAHSRAANAHGRISRLTRRQRQVLEGMVRGFRNKEIAADLGIDEKTVKMHRARLISALEVQSSAGAIRIAVEASFIQANDVR